MTRGAFLLALIMGATLCNAASCCPDPKLQEAAIGGNTINGGVVLHKKPVKFAKSAPVFLIWGNRVDWEN